MQRSILVTVAVLAVASLPAAAPAQSARDQMKALETYRSLPKEEQDWVRENPDKVEKLGELPADQQQQFLEVYNGLSDAEKQKLRDNADKLQNLGADERKWALAHPDAVKQLGNLPKDEQDKFLANYQELSPDERRKLMENADQLQQLSPEERRWALDNPDVVRKLGNLPSEQQRNLMETYRSLPPELQEKARAKMGGPQPGY